MPNKSCIYAGSFDCFHNGHANIVKRALKVFDNVRILVANNPKKKYLFTVDQRINIIHSYFKDTGIIVDVLPDTQLVSDYALEKGVSSILKGIRNLQDTEYEKMLHEVTVSQENGIDTYVLFSDPKDQKISSSAVKELAKFNADVRGYVSLYTKQMLEIHQNGQFIIGVTGGIGCGKSYITNLLMNPDFKINGDPSTHIDLDVIAHELTYGSGYSHNEEVQTMRKTVMKMLGYDDADLFCWSISNELELNLKPILVDRVFTDPSFNAKLIDLYKPVMVREIRKRIAGKQGLIILNGALLVDSDMQYLCNNNVIVVSASDSEVKERLMARYHQPNVKNIENRINAQLSSLDKMAKLTRSIKDAGHGTSVFLENCKGEQVFELPSEQAKSIALYQHLKHAKFFDNVTNPMNYD